MFQATIHLQQKKDCILSEFAEEFNVSFKIAIEELHDHHVTFVIELQHCPDEATDFFTSSEQVKHFEQLDEGSYLVTKESCGAYSAVDRNHGILRRQNVITANRREYTVLFFRREDLKAMIDDFKQTGEVTLGKLSKFNESTAGLTDRQFEVIECALKEGYFEWPRDASSEEISEKLNISRATFLEHLRKAQSKLLTDAIEEDNRANQPGYIEPETH
jgi:predicted DNA binding protein